jgi:hypothetical protein
MNQNKLKLRDWTREHGTSNIRDLPNLLQFNRPEHKQDSLSFFTRKSKLDFNGKAKPDFLGSSSESSIKKLEFELRIKKMESGLGLKGRVSSQKSQMFASGSSLLGERASSARRRDDPMAIYFKSPTKHSRVEHNDDRSGLNESRSLLARMKDEFRNSTNNSLSGVHQRESKIHNQSSGNILIRSIMVKPKIPVMEAPLEDKKISLENLKSEFYNKLSKQRKEMGKGGTLENLFSILNKENRLSREGRDNTSLISKSRHMDTNPLACFETKSREQRISTTDDTHKDTRIMRSFQDETIAFPSDKVSDLIHVLAEVKPSQITPSDRKQLILLRAQIKKIINS